MWWREEEQYSHGCLRCTCVMINIRSTERTHWELATMSAFAFYPAVIPVPSSVSRPSVRSPSVLLAVLHSPRTLAAFVAFVAWPDLHSLLSTCSSLRTALFAHMPTRDVVLSRFVPGFSFCLAHRDMQFFQDVPITVHDLDLLCKFPFSLLPPSTDLFSVHSDLQPH